MSISRTVSNTQTRLSLKQFRDKSTKWRWEIEQIIPSLVCHCCTFSEEQVLTLYNWTRLIDTLHAIQQPIHASYTLLKKTARLPRSVVPHRYQLMIILCPVDLLARELEFRISTLRMQSCMALSFEELSSHQQLIVTQLRSLIQGCKDVVNEICVLLDQIRFQEKQFTDIERAPLTVNSKQVGTRSPYRLHKV